MENIPETKVLSGKLPAAGQASIARSTSVREGIGRSDVRDSKDWYYPAPVKTRKGKNSSLQDQEELMIDVVTFKGSGDSFEEIDPTSFSGASHPPEPVDTGLMRPVYVPIGQSKPEGHFMGLLAWPWHRSLPSGLLMDGEAGFIYFFGPVAVAGRFWCWSEFCLVTERGCMCGFRRMVKVLKLLSTRSKMAREVCSSMAAWVGKDCVESDEWLHTLQLRVCGGSW